MPLFRSLALALTLAVPSMALAADEPPPEAAGDAVVEGLRARILEADAHVDRGELPEALALLEPLERDPALQQAPELLAQVRFLIAKAHLRADAPIAAIAAFSRFLQMPNAPEGPRSMVRQRLEVLVAEQVERAVTLLRDDEPAEAVTILAGLERAGGAVMARDQLAQVRYGLHRTYIANKQPLLAAAAGLRFAGMAEAPAEARQKVRGELDELLRVERAGWLLGNVSPEQAIATLEALQGALYGEPRYLAGVRAALARAHVERGEPREAVRVLRRTIDALPGEMDAERAYFRTEASALLERFFGTIQVLCPAERSQGIRVSIHGPVEKPGVAAETIHGPCSPDLHDVIDGVYVITAYSTDHASDFGIHRLEIAISAGDKKREQLQYVPPVEPVKLYPVLATLSGMSLATALILTAASDAPEPERFYADEPPSSASASSVAAYRKAEAEGFITERAVLASLYAASAVLAIVAAFDYGRVRSEAGVAPAASTSPAFVIRPGGIGLSW